MLGLLASACGVLFVIGVVVAEALEDGDEIRTTLLSDSVKQSETLVTVISVCTAATILISNVGLLIGYLRKKEHLPRQGQQS